MSDPHQYYPTCDEVDLSGDYCPNCEQALFSCTCSNCGGEGGFDGYEEDPLWYDNGDMIPCGLCWGHGYHHWCPRCGWDMLLPARDNTPRQRGRAIAKYDPRLALQPID